jgi:hypothetical protein
MPPAAEELPPGEQPHRRRSRRVREIDFGQLDGLSTSADQELRETEDALVAFVSSRPSATRCTRGRGRSSGRSTSSAGWTVWHDECRDRAADPGPGVRLS